MYCPRAQSRCFNVKTLFFPPSSVQQMNTHSHTNQHGDEGPQVGKGGIFTRLAPRNPLSTVDSRAAGHPTQSRVCLHPVGRSLSHTDRNQPRMHTEIDSGLLPNTSSQQMQECSIESSGWWSKMKMQPPTFQLREFRLQANLISNQTASQIRFRDDCPHCLQKVSKWDVVLVTNQRLSQHKNK